MNSWETSKASRLWLKTISLRIVVSVNCFVKLFPRVQGPLSLNRTRDNPLVHQAKSTSCPSRWSKATSSRIDWPSNLRLIIRLVELIARCSTNCQLALYKCVKANQSKSGGAPLEALTRDFRAAGCTASSLLVRAHNVSTQYGLLHHEAFRWKFHHNKQSD